MSDDVKELLARARLAVSEACDACQSQDGPAYASLTRLHDQLGIMLESNNIASNDYMHQVLLSPTQSRTDDTTSKIPWIRKFNSSIIKVAQGLRGADPQDGAPSTQEIVDVIEDYRTRFATMADAQRMQDADTVLQHLSSMPENVLRVETKINELLTAAMRTTRDVVHRKLDPLTRATLISYNAPNGCLAGTRVNILRQLADWVDDQHATPRLSLFWLSGLAGTGKTAIARTFAERMEDENMLGATFFVDRQDEQRQDAKRIVQTLAYYLLEHDRYGLEALSQSLEDQPDIKNKILGTQVRILIKGPLSNSHLHQWSRVVVIDALDECKGSDGIELITALLANLSDLPIKLLVTSRNDIDHAINQVLQGVPHTARHLRDFDSVVASDIRLYCVHRFTEICTKRQIQSPINLGPSLDTLIERTGSFFIYAVSFLKMVELSLEHPVKKTLELLEVSKSNSGALFSSSHKYHALDKLYHYVLEEAVKDDEGDVDPVRVSKTKKALEFVAFSAEPLAITALARLLDVELNELIKILTPLASVLTTDDAETELLRPFHQSFMDFLREDGRNKRGSIQLDRSHAHAHLANNSLSRLSSSLSLDMCNIQNPSVRNSDVPDLLLRIAQSCPTEVQYALQHWPHHVANSRDRTRTVLANLQSFCDLHLLHWIEGVSLLGSVSHVYARLSALLSFLRVIMSTLPEIENVTKVLQDAQALLRQYGAIIAERALHIYYSAAVLMPDCYLSKLMSRTLKLLPAARLLTPRPLRWDRRQSSISGVTGDVANLAVSSDELYLAAVFTDGKIQLWDLVAELELAKSSYSLDILSVCFMPQSAGIICREKHRIVLREITTLEVLRIVLPHSETATSCMVTSADAQYLALGLEDGGVVLRHTLNLSEYLPPLRFHTAQISCVSFSPDGLLLASTCKNAQFAVWDTDLKYRKHAFDDDEELEAHHMSFNAASNSLAYLVCHDDEPNGMQLRIWNFESSVSEGDDFSDDESDASIVRPSLPSFHCLLHEVYGICVSLNAYNTIEICEPANSEFDATTSTLLTQGAVTSISLSPSGALLACLCGKEGTIQIFNVAHYWKPDHELNPNTRVDEAIMSPDGSQLAYSVVRDAGTRIYVEALDPHRPWKVTVSKIPQENIAFLGITNAASNDIRVVIRRDSPDSEAAVDSYGIEVYRPDKSKQSIANTFQEPPLHVLCPSYCKDLIVITEFPEDIVMNSMHIWNERSSSVMASNICTSVSMSDICIGGSLVVYCRNSDVYFRDLDTIHASEQLLYANISNARFAASALGDAFAVCWCSAQDPTLWLIQIWSHKDNTLTQIASLATSANLGQMRFARDNTNLLLAFADKTTHTIPHGVEMQAVIPSKKITFNPFIFLADDGWICYTVAGRSRLHELCWIPRQWFRHDMLDVVIRGTTIMIGGRGMCEQTIFLDTYPAIEYIETLVT